MMKTRIATLSQVHLAHIRLNVTEQERLCYSRKKLQIVSALRSIGVNPSLWGLHKDYRVPGRKGKYYLIEHVNGDLYHFSSLADIALYIAEYQAWQSQTTFTWEEWRYAPFYPATWKRRQAQARIQHAS